jgi:hypothetical protein
MSLCDRQWIRTVTFFGKSRHAMTAQCIIFIILKKDAEIVHSLSAVSASSSPLINPGVFND